MNWYSSVPKLLIATGTLLLCVGCTGRKEVALGAKDDQIRRDQIQLAQEQADKDSLAEHNKQLAEQNTLLAEKSAQAAQLNAQNTAALTQKLNEEDALLRELGKEFAKGNTTQESQPNVIHSDSQGIHLTVAGSALFDPGKAELKPSAHAILSKIALTLKSRYPQNFIRIEGHTDSTPILHSKEKFKDNMALSLGRAQSVYEYLHNQGGIAAGKMYTAGYGEHQPVVHPERTSADRAKNRRVEIVIMPIGVKVQKDQLASATRPAAVRK